MRETRKLSELHNWDKNPRTITKEGLERLKKQITKLGQYKPLLITEDGTVLGGNMRLKAYQELGVNEVWVSVVDAPTEGKKIEYALSDNDRVGKYEGDQLSDLIGNFPEVEWNDYAVDIKEPQLVSDIMDQYREVEEDEVPEVKEGEAESKLGEVYTLGRHRLMCGDATKIEDVEKLMNGQKADLCYTDPPYGVSYEEKTRSIANQRKEFLPVKNDELGKDALSKIVFPAFQNIATMLKEGGCYYISSPQGGELGLMMMMMMRDAGIEARHMIVWAKDAPVFSMGRLDYDYQHEPILYGWRGGHQHYGNGKYKSSLWNIPRPKDSKLHPTMKPIELIVNIINNSSKQDDIVLDLFGGSGSTLIACEQTNRTCFCLEIDNHYVDVIIKRWMKFTGKRAYKIIDVGGKPCNIPVQFADESFMESKTLQEGSVVKKDE